MDLETATDLRICIKNRPFPGESCSGDFPFYFQNENSLLLGIADGLGHGDKAHDATLKINSYLKDFWHSVGGSERGATQHDRRRRGSGPR